MYVFFSFQWVIICFPHHAQIELYKNCTFSNHTPESSSGVQTINVLSIDAVSSDIGCVLDPSSDIKIWLMINKDKFQCTFACTTGRIRKQTKANAKEKS